MRNLLITSLALCAVLQAAPPAGPVRPVLFEPGLKAGEYQAQVSRGALRLTPAGIEFASAGRPVIRLALVGARHAEPQGDELLRSTSSYFLGSDPKRWRTGVPNYGKVRYNGVYDGMDLVFRGSERAFEYDFLIAPNANPSQIRMRFDGARELSVNAEGDLLVDGWFTQRRPHVYQGAREIGGRFRIHRDRTVSFETASYDHSRALVIDPVITYTSYVGGYGEDVGYTVTTDTAGNIYVGGFTLAANFPGSVAYGRPPSNHQEGFITKFAPIAGGKTQLLFTIFLGDNSGSYLAGVNGLAIDSSGNIIAVGSNSSPNFPALNPVQPQLAGGLNCSEGNGTSPINCPEGFLTKFAPDGSALIFSTFYGGQFENYFNDVAVDSAGDIYAVGEADGPTNVLGTPTAIQQTNKSVIAIEIVRLDPTGKLLYSTYLGGAGNQAGYSIAVEKPGVVWIGAASGSPDIPTTSNAFQTKYTGTSKSAYVARIDTTQSGAAGLTYATFYDGPGGNSTVNKLFLDPSGQVVFCGAAFSTLPTTPTAMQASEPGALTSELSASFVNADGFIARINPAIAGANGLTYASFIGGSDEDWAQSCGLDPQGNFVVAGVTMSGYPFLTPGSPIPIKSIGSGENVFVIRINPAEAGGRIESLLFGGEGLDQVTSMAIDSNGFAYLTGETLSAFFPVTAGAVQETYGGDDSTFLNGGCCGDAWLMQLNLNEDQVGVANLTPFSGDFQSGPTGSALPNPLIVQLADAKGNPLALSGYQITFTATGGATIGNATGYTNGIGVTGTTVKLGATSGTVTATITGTTVSYTFHVYVGSGPVPESVAISSGNNQNGQPNALLPQPLVVQLLDVRNNALALSGVNVLFSPTNASVPAAIVATDSNGRASTTVTLGSQNGSASVQVLVGGLTTVTANYTVGTVTADTTILPQFAFGGGWYSALYFTNVSGAAVSFPVNFVSDAGAPLTVPSVGGSATQVSLPANGTAIIEAPNTGNLSQGYAGFTLPSGVSGYGVFRHTVAGLPDQEAVVPFSAANATSNALTWDETNLITAVAIVNPSAIAATVAVTLREANGSPVGTSSIALPANGKTEAELHTLPGLSGMVGQRGSAQFTVSAGNVAVLGLRADGPALTSIPTTAGAAQANAGASILPQFAFGGGWYSALYFTNFNGAAVSFPVKFVSDAGTPLTVPSVGGSTTQVNLPANGTAIIAAPNMGSLSQGYAGFTLPSGVYGYGVFRHSVAGQPDQEAVVPFSAANATSNTLTWDDTNETNDTNLITAVAIVNPSSTAATVDITLRGESGSIIGTSSIPLPANSKTEAELHTLPGLSGMVGQRGSAQFTVSAGNVAVLGLRANGPALTSIPTTN